MPGIVCSTLEGFEFTCDLGIMTGAQEEAAVAAAGKRSKELGGSDSENDLGFQFAFAVEALLVSAIDPESPTDKPERFFESADQIRDSLDRERILYLSAMQRAFQERISPRTKSMTMFEYYEEIGRLMAAEEAGASLDEIPFWTWPRNTQTSFLATLVSQLRSSQALNLRLGLAAATDTPSA